IRNGGPGIFNDNATLTVSGCTISGNIATTGAGIHNLQGTLTVTNSTISGNSTSFLSRDAILNELAMATVSNRTVSNNVYQNSGAAIYNNASGNFATLIVENCTFSGNTGAIQNFNAVGGSASLTIGSTILSDNTVEIVGNGFTSSLGYNLSDDNGSGFLTNTGDQINANPMLGPLQDN